MFFEHVHKVNVFVRALLEALLVVHLFLDYFKSTFHKVVQHTVFLKFFEVLLEVYDVCGIAPLRAILKFRTHYYN